MRLPNRATCLRLLSGMGFKFAAMSLCAACLLFGEAAGKQQVEVSKTEKLDFPAGGTLRLQNSTGQVNIEGWDQPGVEITTIKSTKDEYAPDERDKAMRELDRVQISTKRSGDELVITTAFPSHRAFPYVSPLDHVTSFYLNYQIKVPRSARIVINHGDGGVYVDGVTGNIEATARQGLISLLLQGDMPRSIEAKSDLGSVTSDFPGNETQRPWPFGHRLMESAPAAAQKLGLKIGFGDIIVLKAGNPKPVS